MIHGPSEIVPLQAKDNGPYLACGGHELHIYMHYELIRTTNTTNASSYKLSFIRHTSYSGDTTGKSHLLQYEDQNRQRIKAHA